MNASDRSSVYLGSLRRRSLLACAAGLGLPGSVFADLRVETAPALSGPPPMVDRLAVRIVTDSYHHLFEPGARVGEVAVERPRLRPAGSLPRMLLNEWGLALHIESMRGAESRQMLVDFGFTPQTLNNNIELLGIAPAQLDAMLLTHGHYDHFGGLAGFLTAHGKELRPRLPLYLGGEECFCTRETGPAAAPVPFGALDRHAIGNAGLRVLFAQLPTVLADHGFSTGTIPQVSFENPPSPTRMRVGLQADGLGCAPERLPQDKRALTLVPDDFQHEQATCFHVKDRGLVVITSCGHRGIVNSVQRAIQVSGVHKVHAILGGFHLMPMPEAYLRSTVAALKQIDPDVLVPMHCSGTKFQELAKQEMPGRVLLSSTGTRFVFGA